MALFDDVPRTRRGPAAHFEDSFSFLTTSSQPYAANVRDLLEHWFSRYPSSERAELRSKFRNEFDVAFFELFLHEVLLRLGCRVTVHPEIPSTRSKPDFEVESSSGSWYVEARVASDKPATELAKDRALAVFFDEVDRLSIDDYFLHLETVEFPPGFPPSARRFRRYVEECVGQVDYHALHELAEMGKSGVLPSFEYREKEALVEFTLIPIKPERRGREGKRAIGMFPFKTRWGSSATAIRRALTRKGGKYGRLPAPFVIAVNSTSEWGTRREDVMEALFGREGVTIQSKPGHGVLGQNTESFWIGPTGPQHRRVSAALIGTVNPYNLAIAELILWINPWATIPYSGPFLDLSYASVTEEEISFHEGVPLRDLLQIPVDWPGDREPD